VSSGGTIALIDYGAGNLTSVRKALTAVGARFMIPPTPAALAGVAGLIVPGVGHFAATAALEGAWRDEIYRAVTAGTPLLGICLGMQWLFEGSDEAPDVCGLGVMKGRIGRLRGDADRRLKIPHVGWNALEFTRPARLLDGLASGDQVYFTHSYAAPITADAAAATTHGDTFAAVVERDNIFGVQFHPEKSSEPGLQMIRNFLRVCAGSC
jgi:imidazole glycerol-phosphate synthase subunit HisH